MQIYKRYLNLTAPSQNKVLHYEIAYDMRSLFLLNKYRKINYYQNNHKECARDCPDDHTATCKCKVLTAERWVNTKIKPIVTMGFFVFLYGIILRSIFMSNTIQHFTKDNYNFPVIVVDLQGKQFFGTNTTCMAAMKPKVIELEELITA